MVVLTGLDIKLPKFWFAIKSNQPTDTKNCVAYQRYLCLTQTPCMQSILFAFNLN